VFRIMTGPAMLEWIRAAASTPPLDVLPYMAGQQITVEYFDQNEDFKTLLPRSGHIVQELSLTDWGSGWKLIDLDEPFDYQHKVAAPYVFKALTLLNCWSNPDGKGSLLAVQNLHLFSFCSFRTPLS